MEELFEKLQDFNNKVKDIKLERKNILLTEGVTYYQLRQFLTIIYKQIKNPDLKTDLLEILKILTKLEVKFVPIPTIKKLKAISPEIFPEDKKKSVEEE